LARRDKPGKEGKTFVAQDGLLDQTREMLDVIQADMHRQALKFRQENTHQPQTYAEFKEVVQDSFALAWWCGQRDCEAKIKDDTKATSRCIPLEQEEGQGVCIHCGQPAAKRTVFARAY
jgi:prolyl-tRNA synthetase